MTQAKLLLRIGLAFTFLYASASSFISPNDWIWYIPDWLQQIIPGNILLIVHGVFEITLGIWLLTGWKGFYASIVAALDLLAITILNIEILDVVFRDVGLLLAAAALAFLYKDQAQHSRT